VRHIRKSVIITAVVVFGLFICTAKPAQETGTKAQVELRQVSLFKNGLGFFVTEVTIPPKTTSFYIVPDAAPSHGTFWVSYPSKVRLDNLVAKEIEVDEQVEATTIPELLRANVGKKARFVLAGTKEAPFDAKILSVAVPPEREIPSPYAPGRISPDEERGYYNYQRIANLMLFETDEGRIAIDPTRIERVFFKDEKPSMTFGRKKKSVQIDVGLGAAAGKEKLTLSYLAKGITWAPSYMIDISEPNKAKIAAKAEVMNEVCDLNGVDVQFVTGFPNLQFADIASPIAMKENLAQFLQSLIRGQSEQGRAGGVGGVMSNVMSQRMAYSGELRDSDALSVMPSYGAAEIGKSAEDLFLYPVEKVNLTKGAVGYFPLFTESVPYKHIYRWEIPDYVSPEGDYYQQNQQQQREPQQEVWHCIRLENVMKLPWTTAPAEIVKDGVILGQDTLDYTPVKEKGTVKITRAMNVKAEQVELETKRERGAAQWYGYNWDLVTVQGKLSAMNLQDKPITLEVTKSLSGEVKSMQPEAKLEKLAKALRAVNTNVRLTWTVELGAGEKKDFTYDYEVYVRR
jgi:hypothetical protein